MNAAQHAIEPLVIYLAVDKADDQYRYRQAFGEAEPTAVLYFFMNGAELTDAIRGYVYPRPALLIMDWDMDSQNGYGALKQLAQPSIWQPVPVVIMTRPNRPVDEARCQQLGYELVMPAEAQHSKLVAQLSGLMNALL